MSGFLSCFFRIRLITFRPESIVIIKKKNIEYAYPYSNLKFKL